jgi:hypothetical protein
VDDFSILETKEECLILILSFFDEGKRLSSTDSSGLGRVAAGRTARADFARAVVRFLIGAYARQNFGSNTNCLTGDAYHCCAMGWHEGREVMHELARELLLEKLPVIDKPHTLGQTTTPLRRTASLETSLRFT